MRLKTAKKIFKLCSIAGQCRSKARNAHDQLRYYQPDKRRQYAEKEQIGPHDGRRALCAEKPAGQPAGGDIKKVSKAQSHHKRAEQAEKPRRPRRNLRQIPYTGKHCPRGKDKRQPIPHPPRRTVKPKPHCVFSPFPAQEGGYVSSSPSQQPMLPRSYTFSQPPARSTAAARALRAPL